LIEHCTRLRLKAMPDYQSGLESFEAQATVEREGRALPSSFNASWSRQLRFDIGAKGRSTDLPLGGSLPSARCQNR
jgi:hypothetical protein